MTRRRPYRAGGLIWCTLLGMAKLDGLAMQQLEGYAGMHFCRLRPQFSDESPGKRFSIKIAKTFILRYQRAEGLPKGLR